MSKLKDASLMQSGANNQKPLSSYKTDHGKQYASNKLVQTAATPRDSGGMADGSTGGNFSASSLSRIPNNSGGSAVQSVADSISEEFANPTTDIL